MSQCRASPESPRATNSRFLSLHAGQPLQSCRGGGRRALGTGSFPQEPQCPAPQGGRDSWRCQGCPGESGGHPPCWVSFPKHGPQGSQQPCPLGAFSPFNRLGAVHPQDCGCPLQAPAPTPLGLSIPPPRPPTLRDPQGWKGLFLHPSLNECALRVPCPASRPKPGEVGGVGRELRTSCPSPSAADGAGGPRGLGPEPPVTTRAAPRIQCPVIVAFVVTLLGALLSVTCIPASTKGASAHAQTTLPGEPCQVSPRRYTGPGAHKACPSGASLPDAPGQLQPPGMPPGDAASVRREPSAPSSQHPGPGARAPPAQPSLQGHFAKTTASQSSRGGRGCAPGNGPAGPGTFSRCPVG